MSDPPPLSVRWMRSLAPLSLLVLVGLLYGRAGGYDFINWDDPTFIYHNDYITAGLSWEGLRWAFREAYPYVMPLSWLSFMLDVSLFGLDPGVMHLTNLALHICNVLLFYVILRQMTGAHWRPFLAALWLGIHPQHVEAVAWVVERKGILAVFFGLLSIWSYLHYARL